MWLRSQERKSNFHILTSSNKLLTICLDAWGWYIDGKSAELQQNLTNALTRKILIHFKNLGLMFSKYHLGKIYRVFKQCN